MRLLRLITTLSFLFGVFCDEAVKEETIKEEAVHKKMEFQPPNEPSAFFHAYFSVEEKMNPKWIKSQAKKDGVDISLAKYDGEWGFEVPVSSPILNDYSLILKSKAKHHAISVRLPKVVDFKDDTLVVQYEVKFQNPMECGGAYIKLLTDSPTLDLRQFGDKTPYTIMFGPDRCGTDNKLHFIFRHKNPVNKEYEEKHAPKPKADLDSYFTDKKSHLYTLVLKSDNSFEVFVDQVSVNSGSLLSDVTPPVNPPKEIDDPNDKKPESWDEREKIADPEAKKPEDWDETQPEMIEDKDAIKPAGWLDDEKSLIPDPKSEKPKDWDAEMDGEWEPPKIDNPKCKDGPGCGPWVRPKIKNVLYKGKWSAPMITNPDYQGVWKPKRIQNPNYFEDHEPYNNMSPVSAIGLELWSMTNDIAFDNFILTNDKNVADEFAKQTWKVKKEEERRSDPRAQSVVDAVKDLTNEKPWVWIIIILVIAVPIALIVYLCCRSSSPRQPSRAQPIPTTFSQPPPQQVETESEKDEVEENIPDKEGAGDTDVYQRKANLESESGDENEENVQASPVSSENDETQKQEVRKRNPNKKKPNKD